MAQKRTLPHKVSFHPNTIRFRTRKALDDQSVKAAE